MTDADRAQEHPLASPADLAALAGAPFEVHLPRQPAPAPQIAPPRPRLSDGAPPTDAPALRVIASGSSGNCAVVTYRVGEWLRFSLIDAGLPPRRILPVLRWWGLLPGQLDAILLTHLDFDHWRDAWLRARPPQARVVLHRRHAPHFRRHDRVHTQILTGEAELAPGVRLVPVGLAHDDQGSTAYRVDFDAIPGAPEGHAASLGFATDLGRATDELVEHLRGVDVLAIESNYCPRLQNASARPAFLKRRIMGGAGHLSNEQALEAIEAIAPREHVVLLHLSRQCNDPGLVAQMHAGADYALTIAHHEIPTRWIRLTPSPRAPRAGQMSLF